MKKGILIFLFMLTQPLGAMQDDDHDKPLCGRGSRLLPENSHEMREYHSEGSDDATYQERDPYANEFAILKNGLSRAYKGAVLGQINLAGIQCAVSGLFSCGILMALVYTHQSINAGIRESNNYITQRIDNLAAQCPCPQIPVCSMQIPNTTDNTTANPFSTPTDTAFLNMISGNMSTNQTND